MTRDQKLAHLSQDACSKAKKGLIPEKYLDDYLKGLHKLPDEDLNVLYSRTFNPSGLARPR